MQNRPRIALVVIGSGLVFTCIICLSLGAIIYLFRSHQFSLPFIGKSDNGVQSMEGTLQPLLSGESFPVSEIDYPPNWPAVLRFPEEFILVEINSGSLNEDASVGWVTKLRFFGEIKQTKDLLIDFFERNNWDLQEQSDPDSNGVIILVELPETLMTGIIVMEQDTTDKAQTLIVVTVHQKVLD